jgi:hypothetical protein
MNRFLGWPALVFALILIWKWVLFVSTIQPVPANDAYLCDGAIVNLLRGGSYVNPSIEIFRPISGSVVFGPYPPLYQLVLLGWMSVFGTFAPSAVGLHLALFCLYAILSFQILRRLGTPVWALHLAGAFLLVITFHDRPDTLAQVLGAGAVYAWLRSWEAIAEGCKPAAATRWSWLATVLAVLTLSASLQIGAMFIFFVSIGIVVARFIYGVKLPLLPLVAMPVLSVLLALIAKFGFPNWWAGFVENFGDNPSVQGWHWPDASSILKCVRTLPGLGLVLLLAPLGLWSRGGFKMTGSTTWVLMLAATASALGVVAASLFYLTSNYVAFAAYLQPLVVGAFLGWWGSLGLRVPGRCGLVGLFVVAIVLGAVRAVGMTTWGVLCARDMGYSQAKALVAEELNGLGTLEPKVVVVSSAFLYGAAEHRNCRLIHSDYVIRPKPGLVDGDLMGLLTQKPSRLILTQFDYYRRYGPTLALLKARSEVASLTITNTANVRPPDASPSLQKVVQHVSWAPVIVTVEWKGPKG